MVEGCRFNYLSDITAERVKLWLKDFQNGGASARTRNAALQGIKQFCNWAVKNNYLQTSPLATLEKINQKTDRRHIRRIISQQELAHLIQNTAKLDNINLGLNGRSTIGIESGLSTAMLPYRLGWGEAIPARFTENPSLPTKRTPVFTRAV